MLIHRRGKDKIIANILEICLKPGMAKTKVVYGCVLSGSADRRGAFFLEAVPGEFAVYKTTEKGKKALMTL